MRRPHRPLTEDECRAMFEKSSPRERVLLVLLWRAGLRSAEACALEVDDVEFRPDGTARVNVRSGKGGKQRFVGLDKRSADVIRGWLEHQGIRRGGILQTRSGRPLITQQVRRSIKLISAKAGIRSRVHAHAFRHRFARELHDEGVGPREIQLALGHTSLATTMIYLQSIGCDQAVETTAAREW